MRFLIREQEFEEPIASGQFAYHRDGEPTGVVESWRVTKPAEGYHFLRVDLDARSGSSGNSYLFHAILSDAGTVERLKLRVFGPQLRIQGDLLPQDQTVTAIWDIDGRTQETELTQLRDAPIWFPASSGLGLLARASAEEGLLDTITLKQEADFQPEVRQVKVRFLEDEEVPVGRHQIWARPYLISWSEQERLVWLDEHGWSVRVERDDGLVAKEKRYFRLTA